MSYGNAKHLLVLYCIVLVVLPLYCSTFRKFSEEFLSTFAGQKIPKEGTCFDYFYDWQSDTFQEWATKVQEKAVQ